MTAVKSTEHLQALREMNPKISTLGLTLVATQPISVYISNFSMWFVPTTFVLWSLCSQRPLSGVLFLFSVSFQSFLNSLCLRKCSWLSLFHSRDFCIQHVQRTKTTICLLKNSRTLNTTDRASMTHTIWWMLFCLFLSMHQKYRQKLHKHTHNYEDMDTRAVQLFDCIIR